MLSVFSAILLLSSQKKTNIHALMLVTLLHKDGTLKTSSVKLVRRIIRPAKTGKVVVLKVSRLCALMQLGKPI